LANDLPARLMVFHVHSLSGWEIFPRPPRSGLSRERSVYPYPDYGNRVSPRACLGIWRPLQGSD
jgi:hypothetical protein